jgi:hypothetical protein
MKLFLLSQEVNSGFDTFDSCVVAARTEVEARKHHPGLGWAMQAKYDYRDWAPSPDDVKVKYLGEAAPGVEAGIIISSFNA